MLRNRSPGCLPLKPPPPHGPAGLGPSGSGGGKPAPHGHARRPCRPAHRMRDIAQAQGPRTLEDQVQAFACQPVEYRNTPSRIAVPLRPSDPEHRIPRRTLSPIMGRNTICLSPCLSPLAGPVASRRRGKRVGRAPTTKGGPPGPPVDAAPPQVRLSRARSGPPPASGLRRSRGASGPWRYWLRDIRACPRSHRSRRHS